MSIFLKIIVLLIFVLPMTSCSSQQKKQYSVEELLKGTVPSSPQTNSEYDAAPLPPELTKLINDSKARPAKNSEYTTKISPELRALLKKAPKVANSKYSTGPLPKELQAILEETKK